MQKAFLFILVLLIGVQHVHADCKSFVRNGFPLGMTPSVQNLSILHTTPTAINASFSVYVEGDASGGDLGGCRVSVEVEGELNGTSLQILPERLETGLGWKDVAVTLLSVPEPPYGNSNVFLKLTDIDNPRTIVRIPLSIENQFVPPTPTRPRQLTPSPTPSITGNEAASPTPPPSLVEKVQGLGKELEESSTKYVVALLAVLFLGVLLWMGFKTLQRD